MKKQNLFFFYIPNLVIIWSYFQKKVRKWGAKRHPLDFDSTLIQNNPSTAALALAAAILLLALAALWGVHAYGHVDISPFDVVTPEGAHLRRSVVDGKAHIVGGTDVRGHMVIPPTVKHGSRTYVVAEIDLMAFDFELGLTRLTLPEGLLKIGESAFYECANLTDTLVLPTSLECIGKAAFCATDLTHVVLRSRHLLRGDPDNPMDLFFSCANLRQLIIDTTVVGIDNDLLKNSFIQEVIVPDSWEELPTASLAGIVNVQKYRFPSRLKKINPGALWGTTAPRVVLPDSLAYVRGYAFRYAQSRCIEFGPQIRYIGASSLADLANLDTLVIRSAEPPQTTPTTFEGTNMGDCVLLVPAESIERYRNDSTFSQFRIGPL